MIVHLWHIVFEYASAILGTTKKSFKPLIYLFHGQLLVIWHTLTPRQWVGQFHLDRCWHEFGVRVGLRLGLLHDGECGLSFLRIWRLIFNFDFGAL